MWEPVAPPALLVSALLIRREPRRWGYCTCRELVCVCVCVCEGERESMVHFWFWCNPSTIPLHILSLPSGYTFGLQGDKFQTKAFSILAQKHIILIQAGGLDEKEKWRVKISNDTRLYNLSKVGE